MDSAGRLSYNLRVALGHLLLGRHRGLAAAWLRGESLPEEALRKLEIMPEPDGDDELEDQARQLVTALSCLATAELPIIFCFDQIEALQLDPQDTSGLIAFGQMISALYAETRRVLIISCVQISFLGALNQSVRGADLDRIREFAEVSLNPLTWDEAQQLIKARMDAQPELKRLRAGRPDPLWPLREAEVKTAFTGAGCIARRLIAHCAALFEAQRGGEAVAIHRPRRRDLSQGGVGGAPAESPGVRRAVADQSDHHTRPAVAAAADRQSLASAESMFPPAWTCCLRAPRATWLSACVTTGPVPDWLRN